jgi:hypothetical protein
MTAHDPARMEVVRRRLNKYVNEGVTPTDGARHEIESALGLDRDALLAEAADDDEEASLEVALFRVVEALRAEMRAGRRERKDDEVAA